MLSNADLLEIDVRLCFARKEGKSFKTGEEMREESWMKTSEELEEACPTKLLYLKQI